MTIYLDKSVAQNKVAAEMLHACLEHTTLGNLTQILEIHYSPDYLQSALTVDKVWMDVLAKIPDPDRVSPATLAPWVIRLVLDQEALNSCDLGIQDIVQNIKMFVSSAHMLYSDNTCSDIVLQF
ncbi:DNA-directed RNA polymerase II subunit rpb1 [Chytriomyces hyalinus]|nr:DNA-directed RNA polymerase II subunit rpb1 [Chytriomyces hyalinus]